MTTTTSGKRPALVAIFDQAAYSASNIALLLLLAGALDPAEFGVFSGWHLAVPLCIAGGRALFGQPFLLEFVARDRLSAETARTLFFGSNILGFVVGGICLLLAFLIAVRSETVLLLVMMPLVPAQDFLRFVGFAMGESVRVLVADMAWVGVQAVGSAAALILGLGAHAFVIAWGAGAMVSALVLFSSLIGWRVGPRESRPTLRAWFATQRTRLWGFSSYAIVSEVSRQLLYLFVAIFYGAALLGAFRLSFVVVGPAVMVVQGLTLGLIPYLRSGGVSLVQRVRTLWAASLVGAALPILAAGSLLIAPRSVADLILGESWDSTHRILPAVALLAASQFVITGPYVVLISSDRLSTVVRLRMLGAVMHLVGFGGVALLGTSIETAVYVSSVAMFVSAVPWFRAAGSRVQIL